MLKRGLALKIFALLLILMFQIATPAFNEEGVALYYAFKSSGRTLYVGGSGPNNYTSIQEAINDANDGDKIFVYPGIYVENVIVDKSIKIIGKERNATIIDGGEEGNVVSMICDGVEIRNFTVMHSGENAYGVLIKSCFNKIFHLTISNNFNGICLHASRNNIIENILLKNNIGIFEDEGTAIYLYKSHSNHIFHCDICNNTNGIIIYNSSNNMVERCIIYENNWSALLIDHSSYNIIFECSIYSNRDYGISLNKSEKNEIKYCKISYNGGGIFLYKSFKNKIAKCFVTENRFIGAYVVASNMNIFYYNDFIENEKETYFNQQFSFILSFINIWIRNYCNDWHIPLVQPIFGYIIYPIPWISLHFFPRINAKS